MRHVPYPSQRECMSSPTLSLRASHAPGPACTPPASKKTACPLSVHAAVPCCLLLQEENALLHAKLDILHRVVPHLPPQALALSDNVPPPLPAHDQRKAPRPATSMLQVTKTWALPGNARYRCMLQQGAVACESSSASQPTCVYEHAHVHLSSCSSGGGTHDTTTPATQAPVPAAAPSCACGCGAVAPQYHLPCPSSVTLEPHYVNPWADPHVRVESPAELLAQWRRFAQCVALLVVGVDTHGAQSAFAARLEAYALSCFHSLEAAIGPNPTLFLKCL